MNCWPSNLLSGSNLTPLPPSLCEYVNGIHYTVCKKAGGYEVLRRKVPLQVKFLGRQHFALPSMSLIFLRLKLSVGRDLCVCGILQQTNGKVLTKLEEVFLSLAWKYGEDAQRQWKSLVQDVVLTNENNFLIEKRRNLERIECNTTYDEKFCVFPVFWGK